MKGVLYLVRKKNEVKYVLRTQTDFPGEGCWLGLWDQTYDISNIKTWEGDQTEGRTTKRR